MFNCHSERACNRWLALDLTGVSVGLVGCYLPGIHYGYYCTSVSANFERQPTWTNFSWNHRTLFVSVVAVLHMYALTVKRFVFRFGATCICCPAACCSQPCSSSRCLRASSAGAGTAASVSTAPFQDTVKHRLFLPVFVRDKRTIQ